MKWRELCEGEQDWFVAKAYLDGLDGDEERFYGDGFCSAVGRGKPRLKLKVNWWALDVWWFRGVTSRSLGYGNGGDGGSQASMIARLP